MREITVFEAKDGARFNSVNDCKLHENLIELRDDILNMLPERPDDCNFANGHGFIQHEPEPLKDIKLRFLKAIEVTTHWSDLKKAVAQQRQNLNTYGFLGRLLDDSASPFVKGHHRLFGCIDELGREWGQPYYRNNPDKAEQIQLNI